MASEVDVEPNNLVTELQPLTGAVCVAGELTRGDRDHFLWTVSETDAAKRWTIVLSGLPGQAGVMQVYRPVYGLAGVSMVDTKTLLGDDFQPGAGPASLADLF